MELRKIVLENFRKFRKLELEVAPGLVGVRGPNGSGKSSLLEGVFFGLTGSPLADCTKESLVRWGEKRGRVELTLSLGGEAIVVERWVGREKATATMGGETVTGAKAVNAFMAQALPIPMEHLRDVLFVAQERLDDPLTGTEAARKDSFGRLFGCARFDKLREILQEAMSRVTAGARPPPAEQVELATSLLRDMEAKAADCLEKEKNLENSLAGLDLRELYKIVNSPRIEPILDTERDLSARLEEAKKRMEEFTPEVVQGFDRPGLAATKRRLADLKSMAATGVCPTCGHAPAPMSKERLEEVEEALGAAEAEEALVARFDQAGAALVALDNALAALPPREACVTEEDAKAAEEVIRQAEADQKALASLVADRKFAEGKAAGMAQTLAGYARQQRAADEAAKLVGVLSPVREMLHRDQLQRRLRAYGAERINEHLAVFSSVFNIPYQVYFTEEGLMRFRDPGSATEHDFSELSGGQRKLVALTYRLALMRLFTRGLNLAVLDEPTAYVDEDNVEAMRDALGSLDEFARGRGMTVFVATHEPMLMPVFPRVVEVGDV